MSYLGISVCLDDVHTPLYPSYRRNGHPPEQTSLLNSSTANSPEVNSDGLCHIWRSEELFFQEKNASFLQHVGIGDIYRGKYNSTRSP